MRRNHCSILMTFIAVAWLFAPAQTATHSGGDFANSTEPFHPEAKLPKETILVKGAWASASDSVTPVPEGGDVANGVFQNPYFGLTYPLPNNWIEKYKGPPPSDSGRYVLAQLRLAESSKSSTRATMLITAQDLFFTPLPTRNALELVNYTKDNLQSDYKLEMPPTPTRIGDRPFMFFAYWSPVAELHWYVLATEIRCHAVEIVLTSRDTALLRSLVLDLNKMQLPTEANPTAGNGGGAVPVCIAGYANHESLVTRVDPVFTEKTFNPVPVRIIIDKGGKVEHIHFLSAFPGQAKAISDALHKWKFKPYMKNGQPMEVETGIMFGNQANRVRQTSAAAVE